MIPKTLAIHGFLSYRQPVQIDFSGLHLACITGHNGAGKSSLLDAITWALFGQARARGDKVITLDEPAAEVAFTFDYEGNTYRIIRRLERGKGSALQFQVQREDQSWRTLSERSLRATQARIQSTLRLDYDTFTNAAFFLQGNADQFTQQTPGARKEILARILGLEAWETWRQRAAARRRQIEEERSRLDGSLAEIDRELAEEPQRRETLRALQAELETLQTRLQLHRQQLEQAREQAAGLESRRQTLAALRQALEQAEAAQRDRRQQLNALQQRLETYRQHVAQADEIRAAYAQLQTLRQELQAWEQRARQHQDYEARRTAPLNTLAAERARLQEAIAALEQRAQEAQQAAAELNTLQGDIARLKDEIAAGEARAQEVKTLRAAIDNDREQYAQLLAESQALKQKAKDLHLRIEHLQNHGEGQCPTCGRPLPPERREEILARLQTEGEAASEAFRSLRATLEALRQTIATREEEIQRRESQDNQQLQQNRIRLGRLETRAERLQETLARWQDEHQPQLHTLKRQLAEEAFAPQARALLAEIDRQIQELGYDAQAHAALRERLAALQEAEARHTELAAAEASLGQIEERITALQAEIAAAETTLHAQQETYNQQAADLAAAEAALPDLDTLENDLLRLQTDANAKNREVGIAEQRVRVLDDLRQRKREQQARREALSLQITRYQQLERAFGKNGVPALIIEQALPQIEAHANDLLARLSDGQMSLRFKTQADYKDKKRKDKKETLDIEISDSAGVRSYEMFSGGEAFRINFAVRLALSRVLAQRKGARLQMLVIDEGFGSQDTQGKQRLIEAINAIRDDFATILVITHLDDLKDAFPTRIEVQKTPSGFTVHIL